MKSIFDKTLKLKNMAMNFIESNKVSLLILLRDSFTLDFLKRLRKSEFLVSEDLIRHHIEKAVLKEKDVELENVNCDSEGIQVSLLVERYMAKVKVNFCISIKTIKINAKRQMIIFGLKNEKIVGDNLSGVIIAVFTEAMLAGIITKSVFPEDILKSIHFKKDHTAAIVDLSDIELIEKLKNPVFGSSKCILDFISINGAAHIESGINLKLKVISFLKK